jgi:uncharacterized membrane protein (DUF441 family)
MDHGMIILLILVFIGIITRIDSLSLAAAILIILRLVKLNFLFPKFETYGMTMGVIIVTISILSPIAEEKYTLMDIVESIKTPLGILAIVGGIIVIYFTGRGYDLLLSDSSIILPVLLGTIIGMVAFKGVPVGPLVASGFTIILFQAYQFISKVFK